GCIEPTGLLTARLNIAIPTDQLSTTFAAFADPTRRAILARLVSGESSVTELVEPFDTTMPAVSKHLRVLERAGLRLAMACTGSEWTGRPGNYSTIACPSSAHSMSASGSTLCSSCLPSAERAKTRSNAPRFEQPTF